MTENGGSIFYTSPEFGEVYSYEDKVIVQFFNELYQINPDLSVQELSRDLSFNGPIPRLANNSLLYYEESFFGNAIFHLNEFSDTIQIDQESEVVVLLDSLLFRITPTDVSKITPTLDTTLIELLWEGHTMGNYLDGFVDSESIHLFFSNGYYYYDIQSDSIVSRDESGDILPIALIDGSMYYARTANSEVSIVKFSSEGIEIAPIDVTNASSIGNIGLINGKLYFTLIELNRLIFAIDTSTLEIQSFPNTVVSTDESVARFEYTSSIVNDNIFLSAFDFIDPNGFQLYTIADTQLLQLTETGLNTTFSGIPFSFRYEKDNKRLFFYSNLDDNVRYLEDDGSDEIKVIPDVEPSIYRVGSESTLLVENYLDSNPSIFIFNQQNETVEFVDSLSGIVEFWYDFYLESDNKHYVRAMTEENLWQFYTVDMSGISEIDHPFIANIEDPFLERVNIHDNYILVEGDLKDSSKTLLALYNAEEFRVLGAFDFIFNIHQTKDGSTWLNIRDNGVQSIYRIDPDLNFEAVVATEAFSLSGAAIIGQQIYLSGTENNFIYNLYEYLGPEDLVEKEVFGSVRNFISTDSSLIIVARFQLENTEFSGCMNTPENPDSCKLLKK